MGLCVAHLAVHGCDCCSLGRRCILISSFLDFLELLYLNVGMIPQSEATVSLPATV
jgi:hypothetical protein